MPAQTATPLSVLVTTLLFALFLSVTAHVAARNVLGDVDPRRALYVGPLPAAVSVVGGGFAVPAAVTVTVAFLLDAVMFRWSYEQPPRVVAVMTVIHAAVTILVGVVLGGIALLLSTRPA
ncbi:hypothetical protein [Halorubrum sp. F4]|uniref:DUF7473 family protein n=1 Tax=Halorubrum sp. F4 TaxID=2989715 RepID=UPI00247FCAC6|nr:hypothetical protein [Halorubrum sp. F4]